MKTNGSSPLLNRLLQREQWLSVHPCQERIRNDFFFFFSRQKHSTTRDYSILDSKRNKRFIIFSTIFDF